MANIKIFEKRVLTNKDMFGILTKLSAATTVAARLSKPTDPANIQLKKLFEKNLKKVLDKRF